MDQNATRERRRLIGCLALVFLLTFLFSSLTPLIADDYNYAFSWATDGRVRSIADIAASMETHRAYTNGRVFSHGLVQLFVMLPKAAFNLVNALMLTLLAAVLHGYLRLLRPARSAALLSLCLALLFLLMPVFGQVFLWLDGACNYGWGLTIALAALLPVFRSFLSGDRSPVSLFLLSLPLGFLAGAWSEHISFAMLLAAAAFVLLGWLRRRRFPLQNALRLLAGCVGYLFLLLSPSVLRQGHIHEQIASRLRALLPFLQGRSPVLQLALLLVSALVGLALLVLFVALALRLFLRIASAKRGCGLLIALFAALFLLVFCLFSLKELRRGSLVPALLSVFSLTPTAIGAAGAVCFFGAAMTWAVYRRAPADVLLAAAVLFAAGLASCALFLAASYFPARGLCSLVTLSCLGGALALAPTLPETGRIKAARILLAILLLLCLTVSLVDLVSLRSAANEREARIEAALSAGADSVELAPYPVLSRFNAQYGLADLEPGADWPNGIMAKYYGLRAIDVPES